MPLVAERRVAVDPRRGVAAGETQQLDVARELRHEEGGQARLARPEQLARPPNGEVTLD